MGAGATEVWGSIVVVLLELLIHPAPSNVPSFGVGIVGGVAPSVVLPDDGATKDGCVGAICCC